MQQQEQHGQLAEVVYLLQIAPSAHRASSSCCFCIFAISLLMQLHRLSRD